MKIKLNKEKVKTLINKYYREVLGIEGGAVFKFEEEYVGYGMSEHKEKVLKKYYVGKMKVLGEESTVNIDIHDADIEKIIRYYLELDGFKLNGIYLDSGTVDRLEGYGMGEHTVIQPYFNGIDADIEKINELDWRRENMKKVKNLKVYTGCLIVVDMVNGFVREGDLHDEKIGDKIPRQIELIKEAKANGKAIIFIKDTHDNDAVEFDRFGGKHCVRGTREAQLVDELRQFENDEDTFVIEKNSTSFMEAPDFRKFIEEHPELIEFDIVGCCTDICDFNGAMGLANYLDQWNRKHVIRVHEDAIATYAEDARQNYVDAAKLLMEQQGIQLVKKMNKTA